MSKKIAPLRIEIQESDPIVRSGTRADGTKWESRTQAAYWHTGDAYPVRMDLSLGRDQQAYPAGFYTLSGSSFVPSKDGYRMELSRFDTQLIPVQTQVQQPQSPTAPKA